MFVPQGVKGFNMRLDCRLEGWESTSIFRCVLEELLSSNGIIFNRPLGTGSCGGSGRHCDSQSRAQDDLQLSVNFTTTQSRTLACPSLGVAHVNRTFVNCELRTAIESAKKLECSLIVPKKSLEDAHRLSLSVRNGHSLMPSIINSEDFKITSSHSGSPTIHVPRDIIYLLESLAVEENHRPVLVVLPIVDIKMMVAAVNYSSCQWSIWVVAKHIGRLEAFTDVLLANKKCGRRSPRWKAAYQREQEIASWA